MEYKENWDLTKKRLDALINNELIDRCCMVLKAPKKCLPDPFASPTDPKDFYSYYMDGERILDRYIKSFENTKFMGESFPVIWPNFGPAGHAKYFKNACFQFTKESLWFEHNLNLQKEMPEYDPNSKALKEELKTVKYLVDESKGKYMVSMPDNCGVLDSLAALRGSQELLMDLVDYEDEVKKATDIMLNGWKESIDLFFNIIKENNEGGSTHGWMSTWSEGRHAQMQVDFSAMISPDMYEEFALKELIDISNYLNYSIYHLDGQEQIRHLEHILSVENINMIQWTRVAGQPKTSYFIDTLKKIQSSGKGLVLYPEKDEVELLLTELSSKGLQLCINNIKSVDEANDFIKLANKISHE